MKFPPSQADWESLACVRDDPEDDERGTAVLKGETPFHLSHLHPKMTILYGKKRRSPR